MSSRRGLGVGVCLLLFTICLSPLIGAPAPRVPTEPKLNPTDALHNALNANHSMDYKELNLDEIVTDISTKLKIPITVDRVNLQREGRPVDSIAVEFAIKDVTFRTALRQLLGSLQLSYVIVDGNLIITTETAALTRQMKQQIDFDFNEIPLQTAINHLSKRYGVTVVFDPQLVKDKSNQTPVTAKLDDVSFEAAIRILCAMVELKPARIGNVILITTEAKAAKVKGSDRLVPEVPMPPSPNLGFPGGKLGFAGFNGL